MRNRKKQQELIKAKVVKVSLEEKLDLHDYCGIKDPTPYEAVKNMIRKGESVADYRICGVGTIGSISSISGVGAVSAVSVAAVMA